MITVLVMYNDNNGSAEFLTLEDPATIRDIAVKHNHATKTVRTNYPRTPGEGLGKMRIEPFMGPGVIILRNLSPADYDTPLRDGDRISFTPSSIQ